MASPGPVAALLSHMAGSSTDPNVLAWAAVLSGRGLQVRTAASAARSAIGFSLAAVNGETVCARVRAPSPLPAENSLASPKEVADAVGGNPVRRPLTLWALANVTCHLASRLEGDRATVRALSPPIGTALTIDESQLVVGIDGFNREHNAGDAEVVGGLDALARDGLVDLHALEPGQQIACIAACLRPPCALVAVASRVNLPSGDGPPDCYAIKISRVGTNAGLALPASAGLGGSIKSEASMSGAQEEQPELDGTYCDGGGWPAIPSAFSDVPLLGDVISLRRILHRSFTSMKAAGSTEAQAWSTTKRREWWA